MAGRAMSNSPEPAGSACGDPSGGASCSTVGETGDYTRCPSVCPKRRAAWGLVIGLVVAAALVGIDEPVARFMTQFGEGGRFELGGDVQRAMAFVQQFGDLVSSVLVGLAILLLDRGNRARLLDWLAAGLATALASWALKMLIGRPRPRLGEPMLFLGPTREWTWTVEGGAGVTETVTTHAMRLSGRGVSDLWSMPSSHASAAAACGVALAWMYPRLRPLVVGLVAAVACTRVVFGAHYASDVAVGTALGFAISTLAMGQCWGRAVGRRVVGRRMAAVLFGRENRTLEG